MHSNRFQEPNLVLRSVNTQVVRGAVSCLRDLPQACHDSKPQQQALQIPSKSKARRRVVHRSQTSPFCHRQIAVGGPEMSNEERYLTIAQSKHLGRDELLIAVQSTETKCRKPRVNGIPSPVSKAIGRGQVGVPPVSLLYTPRPNSEMLGSLFHGL